MGSEVYVTVVPVAAEALGEMSEVLSPFLGLLGIRLPVVSQKSAVLESARISRKVQERENIAVQNVRCN